MGRSNILDLDDEATPDRKHLILNTVEDLVFDFLYYGRKEDEDLPVGEIQEAITAGEISVAEIVDKFRQRLLANI